jgi:hypothetical protein
MSTSGRIGSEEPRNVIAPASRYLLEYHASGKENTSVNAVDRTADPARRFEWQDCGAPDEMLTGT